jgi:hypothetical protein
MIYSAAVKAQTQRIKPVRGGFSFFLRKAFVSPRQKAALSRCVGNASTQ